MNTGKRRLVLTMALISMIAAACSSGPEVTASTTPPDEWPQQELQVPTRAQVTGAFNFGETREDESTALMSFCEAGPLPSNGTQFRVYSWETTSGFFVTVSESRAPGSQLAELFNSIVASKDCQIHDSDLPDPWKVATLGDGHADPARSILITGEIEDGKPWATLLIGAGDSAIELTAVTSSGSHSPEELIAGLRTLAATTVAS